MTMMGIRLSPPRLLPLTIVVMLLLLSAKAVTFARNAGGALSAAPVAASEAVPAVKPVMASIPSVAPAPIAEVSPSERALLQDLMKRRDQLDVRERSLDARNDVMEATEQRLQSKITQLTELQASLTQLDTARKQRQDSNWSGLVKIYESMKARDAASIFDVLDMHVLLEVLDRMNERKAAAILAAMQPERARLATQMLAQKRLRQDLPVSPATAPIDKYVKLAN